MIGSTDVCPTDAGARPRRRGFMPALVGALTLGAACFGGASSAWAGPGLTVQTSLPNPVTVGETLTGVRQTELRVQNTSFTGPGETTWGADSFTLGDLTLVPSCGSIAGNATGDCPFPPMFPFDARDPGVIVPSPLVGNAVG